jgi:site-specific recombinase XerD
MKTALNSSSPSQPGSMKPATSAGFRFLDNSGDMKGTKKHIDYKPAQLHDSGEKWFVWFSFRDPSSGQFKRFRVYEGINSIKKLSDKREFASLLVTAVNNKLDRGYSPYQPKEGAVIKSNSLIQGLNYFKQNLIGRGLRKRTIQSYESVLRAMYEGLSGVLLNDINSISKQQIGSFLRNTASKNQWSNATYNNNLTFLRAIFNYLVDQEIMESNPASKVKPLPQSTHRHKYFDEVTFDRIKKSAPPDLLRFLMFLYHTGTRPNEARQLEYKHILRDRGLLFIPSTISKNKKDDYIPLHDYIKTHFYGTGKIFGTSVNYYSQKFNKLKKELELSSEYTLYSIKHTAAIAMARANVPPYDMMNFFRHSGLEITMAYLRDLGTTVSRGAVDAL